MNVQPDHFDPELLTKIETNFHAVIRSRAADLVAQHQLKLPHIDESILGQDHAGWFAVPGMFGGFSFWLEQRGTELVLVTESWCRVVEGSEQRHEVTAEAWTLVEEGFD